MVSPPSEGWIVENSLDHHDERLAFFDHIRAELRPGAVADVLCRVNGSGRDEQDFAGLARVKRDWMPDKDNLLTLGICSRNVGALTIGGSAAAASRGVLTIEQIKRAVCGVYGITRREIESSARTQRLLIPRHIAMTLARRT